MKPTHSKRIAMVGAGLTLVLAGALTGCSPDQPAPGGSSTTTEGPTGPASSGQAPSTGTAGSSPAPTSTTSAPPTTPAADPADVKWNSGIQVVPATGPVKLPAPKTEKAALETTFQLVERYVTMTDRIERAKSTDTKPVEPFVSGRLLAQLKIDTKTYAAAKWTFTGNAEVERVLGLNGSYARTMGVTGKDGTKKKAKYGATWLRYCADSSGVKNVAGPDGKLPQTAAQKRRLFEAQAQYDSVNGLWYLVENRAIEGSKEQTTC